MWPSFKGKSKYWEPSVAFVTLLTAVVVAFFPFFREPARLLPSAGDGMKNYFTYLYHIKFDKELWRFDGMNYPFGENVVFTDNQPILSALVKIFYRLWPVGDATLIAIHNWTIFLGLILGGLGIFICLRYRNVPFVFSLLISVGLMFLQPQIARFFSHFSLVYPFLPWIFYFWLRLINGEGTDWSSVWIGLLTIFAGLIHLYHFLAIAVFCLLAITYFCFFSTRISDWLTGLKMAVIQVFVPLAVLLAMSNRIYPVPDRPAETWGFFSYTANVLSYFFSFRLPLYRFIDSNFTPVLTPTHPEAFNYIGIVAVVFLLGLLVAAIKGLLFSKKLILPRDKTDRFLIWVFITTVLVSFGLPFTITGLEWLLDYAGPYKQFRSIGRIGWVSFYAINLMAWPWMMDWLGKVADPFRANVYRVFLVVILLIEGLMMIPDMNNPPQLLDAYSARIPEIPVNTSDYQALLPDPYLHVGSECFGWPDMGGNQDQNFILGYKLGLPSLGVVMSRTGLSQSLLSNELMCKPYKVPDIINLLKARDPRPLLVMRTKLNMHNKDVSLDHWTRDAPVVFENDQFALKRLELSAFDTVVARFNAMQRAIPEVARRAVSPEFRQAPNGHYWAFETEIPIDTSMAGEANLTFTAECRINSDVNSIIDLRQTDRDGKELKSDSHRANYYYDKIDGNRMFVSIPVPVFKETNKLWIRVSKYSQKKSDPPFFRDCRVIFAARH